MSGRTHCITPTCRRTGPADKFPGEMICGKCFRSLPQEVRADHRRYWREIRKWERRITKTSDELKLDRMHSIRNMWVGKLQSHWDAEIKARMVNPQKPVGLDAVLQELGL